MLRLILLLTLLLGHGGLLAELVNSETKPPSWWEKRNAMAKHADIFYPHNAHMDVMEQEGDSCLLCHSYSANTVVDEQQLKPLTTIANEALEQICHDCHVVDLRAPWRCDLCHPDKTAIWPDDHNFGYVLHHSEDARRDEAECRTCHLDLQFCTDCHFRRDTSGDDYHPMGYQSRHGIDARMMGSNCGRCHNTFYCNDCHRSKQ